MSLTSKLYLLLAAVSFSGGIFLGHRIAKPSPPQIRVVEKEKIVKQIVTQRVYVKAKRQVTTTVDTKPNGERIVSETHTVEDTRSDSTAHVDIKTDTSLSAHSVGLPGWSLGLSLSLQPSTTVLGRQLEFRGSRRLFGGFWVDLTLQTQPNRLSRTAILLGAHYEF